MSRNVAGEELRVGRGDLHALDNINGGANDHVVGLLVEGVVRVGNAVVIHDTEERIEGAIVELLVVGGAIVGLVESIGAQHGDGAIHDLDQLLVGGEVLEAFGCIAHLGAMIVIQIGLQAIDQIALIFRQIDGTRHAQQAYDHRVGHIGLVGPPRLKHVAVGLVLLLLGAQAAHGQAAALAAHEARVGQHLEADAARVQRILLVRSQADQQGTVREDDLAALQIACGHNAAAGDLRHAHLPGGILILERRQMQIQQLRRAFRADHGRDRKGNTRHTR